MSTRWNNRERAGAVLSLLGVLTLVASVVHYFIDGHRPDWVILIIGATIGFVGFYLLDPKGAEAVEGTVTGTAVQILSVIRMGRRKSDTVVTTATTGPVVVTAIPAPPPVTPVVIPPVQHDPGA